MSITIRETRNGVSIRTTGADAARLMRSVTAALAPERGADASGTLPNRSKPKGEALGATPSSSVRLALKSPPHSEPPFDENSAIDCGECPLISTGCALGHCLKELE